jgi:hypothetical protein
MSEKIVQALYLEEQEEQTLREQLANGWRVYTPINANTGQPARVYLKTRGVTPFIIVTVSWEVLPKPHVKIAVAVGTEYAENDHVIRAPDASSEVVIWEILKLIRRAKNARP